MMTRLFSAAALAVTGAVLQAGCSSAPSTSGGDPAPPAAGLPEPAPQESPRFVGGGSGGGHSCIFVTCCHDGFDPGGLCGSCTVELTAEQCFPFDTDPCAGGDGRWTECGRGIANIDPTCNEC
jgi:hypothetical protein